MHRSGLFKFEVFRSCGQKNWPKKCYQLPSWRQYKSLTWFHDHSKKNTYKLYLFMVSFVIAVQVRWVNQARGINAPHSRCTINVFLLAWTFHQLFCWIYSNSRESTIHVTFLRKRRINQVCKYMSLYDSCVDDSVFLNPFPRITCSRTGPKFLVSPHQPCSSHLCNSAINTSNCIALATNSC